MCEADAAYSVQSSPAANVTPETILSKIGSDASLPASNIASETIHVKMESDAYVSEPAVSVGKSPSQNGTQASERISGAAGLGEGTPKVCPFLNLKMLWSSLENFNV